MATVVGPGIGCLFGWMGASANVVIVDLARKGGYRITYWHFFQYGSPAMIGSVALRALCL